MTYQRSDDPSLRDRYGLHFQIGLVLSLALLLGATEVPLSTDQKSGFEPRGPEIIDIQQVKQTRLEKTASPSPPKPPAPRVTPRTEVIEASAPALDASLDLDVKTTNTANPSAEDRQRPATGEVFVDVQKQPDCGGAKALRKNIRYPPAARKMDIEGRVFVQFVVDKKGRVTNPRVVRGAHELLNKAALRTVKRLNCTPGKQRSHPVKVKMTTPVIFALSDDS